MTLYGLATFSLFIYAYFTMVTQISIFESLSFFTSILAILLLIVIFLISFLPLFCGVQLLKENVKCHKLAFPVSIIIMLAFPLGTAVGGLYLWQRYRNT